MANTDDLLCEQASQMVATSQMLRADRAAMGRARLQALAAQRQLREETNILSHHCHDCRRDLNSAVDRWAYVARYFHL